MDPKKSKNSSPRIKVIQKLYNALMNPDATIDYPKSQYKKFIKDVVSGTLERSELIEDTINQHLSHDINLKKTGYCCLSCSENIQIFANGFCKKCFFESPMSGDWVMKPELSKAHLEIEDRDLEYEKKIQIQDHIVYLSKTSETKVGVTRSNNKTTRWIDQGAIEAIELIKVPNRYLAGIAEVKLKQKFSDKTNWRKMLTSQINDSNLKNPLLFLLFL